MALIHCPECGTEISSEAVSCPKCGKPMCEYDIELKPSQSDDSSAGTFFRVLAALTWIGGLILAMFLGNFLTIFSIFVISGGVLYCTGKVVDYIWGIYHVVTNLKFVCVKKDNKNNSNEQHTNHSKVMTTTVDTVDNATSKQEIKAETSPVSSSNFLSSNYIKFGSYPQAKDGTDKTPIEWLVLAHDDNKALLISRYGLDSQPYNTELTDITWEKCTLRKWLNETFLNTAFSKEEQTKIFANCKCKLDTCTVEIS